MVQYNVPVKNVYNITPLPVPPLEEAMCKFLEWVKPLVSDVDYEEAVTEVEKFVSSDLSTELQNILKEKAATSGSWLSNWWMKYVYLSSRGPISPECNAPLAVSFPGLQNQGPIKGVAAVLYSAAVVYKEFKTTGVTDLVIKNKQISLDQTHGLFAAMRHPKIGMDEYYINDHQSENIVFSFKNRLYDISVIKDNKVVDFCEIYSLISRIVNSNAEPLVPNANYVSFSTNRDEAAVTLEEMLSIDGNQEAYQKVKDAIMFASYDDIVMKSVEEELTNAVYNKDYLNRWHGKSINMNFTKDGKIVLIADHTYLDGGTEMLFLQNINTIIAGTDLDVQAEDEDCIVQELSFEIPLKIKNVLLRYQKDFLEYMNTISHERVLFEGLDRQVLRENGVLSGDGFIHMAFQMAQLKTYGKYYNTYIAVDNRTFFKGRTECLRPISNQSLKFIEEFNKGEKSFEELFSLLQDGLNEHYKRLKDCQRGHGVNRYSFGLEIAATENAKTVALFNTNAWKVIASNQLSTSSVVSPFIKYCFFQPVHADGFGIFYVINDESYMVISSYEKDLKLRKAFIKNTQDSIRELLDFIKNREGK